LGFGAEKSSVWVIGSWNQAEFFRQLNRLGAPPGAQFVKNAAGMGLDGVFADEKLGGDFAVAQALRDEFQDFQFARSDAEGFAFAVVWKEGFTGWDGNFLYDDALLLAGKLQAKPNTENRENGSDETAVDLDGVLDYQESVLRPFQRGDE